MSGSFGNDLFNNNWSHNRLRNTSLSSTSLSISNTSMLLATINDNDEDNNKENQVQYFDPFEVIDDTLDEQDEFASIMRSIELKQENDQFNQFGWSQFITKIEFDDLIDHMKL